MKLNVLDSEQMNASQFTKVARQLIYKRFSEVIDLMKSLGRSTKYFKSHVFKKMKTKIIDARKMLISATLKSLISQTKDPKPMLLKLGLSESFFTPAKVDPRQTIPDSSDSSLPAIMARCFTAMGRSSWASQAQAEVKQAQEYVPIFIPFEFVVGVGRQTMARDVVRKVKNELQLSCVLDYKLCLEIGSRENRVIDQDQLIWPYYELVKEENRWLITKLLYRAKEAYFQIEKPKICFKKVLFLPSQFQMPQLKKDPQRLRVLSYQLFRQVKRMKFYLNYDSYCLLIALHCLYQHFQSNKQTCDIEDQTLKITQQNIMTTLPEIITQTHELQEWMEGASLVLLKLQNRSVIQKSGDLELILINHLKSHTTYGTTLYYVQLHESMEKHLQELALEYSYNMWLSVGFEGLALLLPANKKIVLATPYLQLQKVTALCSSVQLTVERKPLRLNTDQAYQISYLVAIYQQLNMEVAALL